MRPARRPPHHAGRAGWRLQEAHRACEAARDANTPDVYYQLNEVFHQRIYEASHNGFLVEQATALHRRLRPYRRLQLRVRNRMATSFNEHQAIVDAILKGDSDLASAQLRAHVTVQGNVSPTSSRPFATSRPAPELLQPIRL